VDKGEIDKDRISQSSSIANVLIVDDDPELARFMLKILAQKGIRGIIAANADAAIDSLDKAGYDLVFTCDRISQGSSRPGRSQGVFDLLRRIMADSPEMPVVMMAEPGKQKNNNHRHIVEAAVDAVRAGCCDFLIKPPEREKIESLLDTLLPNHPVQTCDSAEQGIRTLYQIVGKSQKLLQTVTLAKKIAPTSVPVLISGESGTGKELVSYLIHHHSKRAQGPYVRVNCAALRDSLLESELFGHEKGAFTGAYTQRKGRFEMAHGGTLLLDEITETPIKFQAKLLRVLEQQDFERVGGNDNVKVDVRIVSTTNKDLLQEVAEGRFRRDLYYRLTGVRLIICPLRRRTEDLPDLVWHFVNLYARQAQRRITSLDPAMMNIFAKYDWPGNIRQLRNVVLTSLILGVGRTLSLADVSWLFDELQPRRQENELLLATLQSPTAGLGGIPLVQIEKQAILDTLRQTAGNKTQAAKALGISDRTLRDKIRRYRQQKSLQPVG
jgi:DNA-binding NtrC family response regulator